MKMMFKRIDTETMKLDWSQEIRLGDSDDFKSELMWSYGDYENGKEDRKLRKVGSFPW